MNRPTIRISTLAVSEIASPQSSRNGGSGSTRMTSKAITPKARPMSLPIRNGFRRCKIPAIRSGHANHDRPRNLGAAALILM